MREGRAQTVGRDALAAAGSTLWLIPLGCLLAGVALSFATTAVDSANGFNLLPSTLTGSPAGAREILSTIAQSTVQLTGLVLSLSLVVIQLAMGQFSPRIVRSLLNDRRSQWAIGIFVGTVAFSLFSIRRVGEGGEVPGLTMWTHTRDPAYGFRKLVDIAERSIADPFDDPTTAVHAIDRLHDCLRQLSGRRLTSGEWRDREGVVRLRARQITWEGYVRLAFEELSLAGAGSPQVTRKLKAALLDVREIAPPERVGVVDHQLDLLTTSTRGAVESDWDVEFALTPDPKGIGAR